LFLLAANKNPRAQALGFSFAVLASGAALRTGN
jgi:hypothetical protein